MEGEPPRGSEPPPGPPPQGHGQPSYPPGYPPQGYPPQGYQYAGPRNNALAIASMISGIASLAVGVLCYFGIISAPAAIVMGVMARRRIRASNGMETGAGMALAGIITGAIALVFLAAWIAFLVVQVGRGEFDS